MEERIGRANTDDPEPQTDLPTMDWLKTRSRELFGGTLLSIGGLYSYAYGFNDLAMQVASRSPDPGELERSLSLATTGTVGAIVLGGIGAYYLGKGLALTASGVAKTIRYEHQTRRERSASRNH